MVKYFCINSSCLAGKIQIYFYICRPANFRDLFYPFYMLFTIILGQCYLILHIYQIFWCTVKINGQFNVSVIGYGQLALAWYDHLTTLGAWSI